MFRRCSMFFNTSVKLIPLIWISASLPFSTRVEFWVEIMDVFARVTEVEPMLILGGGLP